MPVAADSTSTLKAAGGPQFARLFQSLPLSAAEGRAALAVRSDLARDLAYVSSGTHHAADGTLILGAGAEIGISRVADYASGKIGRFFAAPAALKLEIYSAALIHALQKAEAMLAAGEVADFTPLIHSAGILVEALPDDHKAFPFVVDLGRSVRCAHDVVCKHYVTALRKAFLSLLLARSAGLPAQHHAGMFIGGALAGIGMAFMDPSMMAKEQLSDDDFGKIRSYPVLGFRVLAMSGQIGPAVLRAVHDHQKQLNNAGYPEDGYPPDTGAQIVGVSTALCAMLWRGTPVGKAVKVLTQPTDGLPSRYDRRVLDALDALWSESGYRDEDALAVSRDVVEGRQAYECAVFDNLTELVAFLEGVMNCVGLLQKAETGLQVFIRGVPYNRQSLEKFLEELTQVMQFPRMMGLTPGADLEDIFSDPAALRETEEEAYTVYIEMYRHARIADRHATSLRQSVGDRKFREVLGFYVRGVKELFRISGLIRHRPRTPA